MRLIFACSPGKKHLALLRKCSVEHILISYAFIKDVDYLIRLLDGYEPKSFTLDSGAFSVWANGKTIDIEAYTRFARELREKLSLNVELNVVNLDVLPGEFGRKPTDLEREESAEKGWANMLRLEKEGLKVIHVYHQHEKIDWLEKLRAHSDYIGISPANDCSMKEKQQFLDKTFGHIKNSVKTHGFAVTSHTQLYRYPFYSCDSSSWVAAARFGRIPIFCDDLTVKSLQYKDKEQVIKYWPYLQEIGIKDLASDDWTIRTELSIKTFQRLQEITTKLWKSRGITW